MTFYTKYSHLLLIGLSVIICSLCNLYLIVQSSLYQTDIIWILLVSIMDMIIIRLLSSIIVETQHIPPNLMLLRVALFSAIFEELIFRYLLPICLSYIISDPIVFWFCAIGFGLNHLPNLYLINSIKPYQTPNLIVIAYQCLISIFIGIILQSQLLLSHAIILHLTYNLLAFISEIINPIKTVVIKTQSTWTDIIDRNAETRKLLRLLTKC